MIDQPFHQFAHRLGPSLIVEHPEHAAGLPCRHQRTVRHLEQHIIVGQVGQRRHVLSQFVCQLVQGSDDEAALAEVEARQILVQLLIELVRKLAQPGYAPFTIAARLKREYHSPERAVSQFVSVEFPR